MPLLHNTQVALCLPSLPLSSFHAPPSTHPSLPLQMEALQTASGFHSWLQQHPMRDGSWAREGVLHLRIEGFETPEKALQYLQVC